MRYFDLRIGLLYVGKANMFEFIVKMGLATGGTVIVATFFVVFMLAEPGKEISFWGIKFHKKRKSRRRKLPIWRPLPKVIPENWKKILKAFSTIDHHYVGEKTLFHETNRTANLSELKTREVCVEMINHGLVEHSGNYYILKDKALNLVNGLEDK